MEHPPQQQVLPGVNADENSQDSIFFTPHSIMPVFAEALDNIAKYHVGVNYIHTQEGSLMMNYRLIPPLGPCLLNLMALLKSNMDISHWIDCLSKRTKKAL